MLEKITLLIGTVILATGVLIVFFGGTWEGARLGLEILGVIWLLQTSYKVLFDDIEEKRKSKQAKVIANKYFNENLKTAPTEGRFVFAGFALIWLYQLTWLVVG